MVFAVGGQGGKDRGVGLAGLRRKQRAEPKVLRGFVGVIVHKGLCVLGQAQIVKELRSILRLDLVEVEHKGKCEISQLSGM